MFLIRYSVKSKPSISDEISKHNNCAASQLLKSHLDSVIKQKITVSDLSFSAVQMGGLSDLKPVRDSSEVTRSGRAAEMGALLN